MTNYGWKSSSSCALTAEERAIAEYYADAECERKRPRDRAAYRATVLARKVAELIETRNARDPIARIVAETLGEIETPPVDDFVPVDPLIAAQRWREARAAARCEQPELLARLRAEQARDHSWR